MEVDGWAESHYSEGEVEMMTIMLKIIVCTIIMV